MKTIAHVALAPALLFASAAIAQDHDHAAPAAAAPAERSAAMPGCPMMGNAQAQPGHGAPAAQAPGHERPMAAGEPHGAGHPWSMTADHHRQPMAAMHGSEGAAMAGPCPMMSAHAAEPAAAAPADPGPDPAGDHAAHH